MNDGDAAALIMEKRSTEKELIDLGPSFYSQDEYAECLRILFIINRLMGFFRHTRLLLKRLPNDASVVDVGCGGGRFVLHLSRYFPRMSLQGVDVSAPALALASAELQSWQALHLAERVCFKQQEAMRLDLAPSSVDVILATLVCHHMDDDDLVDFLTIAHQAARRAVIIHDLHRHVVAYWGYKMLSYCLCRNRLIRHDGLISIQRGFKRAEWQAALKRAGIHTYRLTWHFPFRWSLILWKK